jgi:hypothetical protein
LLTRKIAKTNNILAPNFGENHADIIYIWYSILDLILYILAWEKAKTHIVLA